MKRAPLTARFLAFVIDVAFLWLVAASITGSIVAGYSIGAGRVSFKDPVCLGLEIAIAFFLSNLCLFLFYFTYLTAHGERNIGKGRLQAESGARRDETNLGWGRAFARAWAYFFSAFPFLFGFFVAFLLREGLFTISSRGLK